ncbi:hypothetical protein BKA62DRAFT_775532 [Auriculariales sp. MPI-PUGE-AT-0066]|nr:hypothetical protein BKA62DRAFT_775532 [Auriculariales sp. MPI-PUGE-AT-0066]
MPESVAESNEHLHRHLQRLKGELSLLAERVASQKRTLGHAYLERDRIQADISSARLRCADAKVRGQNRITGEPPVFPLAMILSRAEAKLEKLHQLKLQLKSANTDLKTAQNLHEAGQLRIKAAASVVSTITCIICTDACANQHRALQTPSDGVPYFPFKERYPRLSVMLMPTPSSSTGQKRKAEDSDNLQPPPRGKRTRVVMRAAANRTGTTAPSARAAVEHTRSSIDDGCETFSFDRDSAPSNDGNDDAGGMEVDGSRPAPQATRKAKKQIFSNPYGMLPPPSSREHLRRAAKDKVPAGSVVLRLSPRPAIPGVVNPPTKPSSLAAPRKRAGRYGDLTISAPSAHSGVAAHQKIAQPEQDQLSSGRYVEPLSSTKPQTCVQRAAEVVSTAATPTKLVAANPKIGKRTTAVRLKAIPAAAEPPTASRHVAGVPKLNQNEQYQLVDSVRCSGLIQSQPVGGLDAVVCAPNGASSAVPELRTGASNAISNAIVNSSRRFAPEPDRYLDMAPEYLRFGLIPNSQTLQTTSPPPPTSSPQDAGLLATTEMRSSESAASAYTKEPGAVLEHLSLQLDMLKLQKDQKVIKKMLKELTKGLAVPSTRRRAGERFFNRNHQFHYAPYLRQDLRKTLVLPFDKMAEIICKVYAARKWTAPSRRLPKSLVKEHQKFFDLPDNEEARYAPFALLANSVLDYLRHRTVRFCRNDPKHIAGSSAKRKPDVVAVPKDLLKSRRTIKAYNKNASQSPFWWHELLLFQEFATRGEDWNDNKSRSSKKRPSEDYLGSETRKREKPPPPTPKNIQCASYALEMAANSGSPRLPIIQSDLIDISNLKT